MNVWKSQTRSVGENPSKYQSLLRTQAHRAKGGPANRGEDVLWKISQKDAGILAEAVHRAVAVREGLFANGTYERSPVNVPLVMHLPAASSCGSDISLPSVCLGVWLIYLVPLCMLVPVQSGEYHHGCEVLYPLCSSWQMVGSKTARISQPEGAEGQCSYGFYHGEQEQVLEDVKSSDISKKNFNASNDLQTH